MAHTAEGDKQVAVAGVVRVYDSLYLPWRERFIDCLNASGYGVMLGTIDFLFQTMSCEKTESRVGLFLTIQYLNPSAGLVMDKFERTADSVSAVGLSMYSFTSCRKSLTVES